MSPSIFIILNSVVNKKDDIRMGQAIFNEAFERYPEETNRLRSTEVDCFYKDDNILPFLEALEKELAKMNK